MIGLIRATLVSDYAPAGRIDDAVTRFRDCTSDSLGGLLLKREKNIETVVDGLNESITDPDGYQELLMSMSEFVESCIDRNPRQRKDRKLVGRLLRLIEEDTSISPEDPFYVSPDGSPIPKSRVLEMQEIHLESFLLGVWHYALMYRQHNDGKETFARWCTEISGNNKGFNKNAFKASEHKFKWDKRAVLTDDTDNVSKDDSRITAASEAQNAAVDTKNAFPGVGASALTTDDIGIVAKVEALNPVGSLEIQGALDDVKMTAQRVLQATDSVQNKATETQDGSENQDDLLWLSDYRSACIKEYSKVTVFHYPGKRVDFKSVFVLSDVIHDGERKGGVTLSTLREWNEHIIIIGIGGMGKSMLMRHLFLSALEQQQDGRIPVFISLVKYKGERFYKFIAKEMSEFKANVDESAIEILAEEGKLLLFLDALDEVEDASDREDIEREIQKFARNYEETQIIMSCRDLEDVWNYGHFERIDICPFSDKQAMTFIAHFMGAGKEDSINRLYQYWLRLSGADDIIDEEPTPLLLSIMATTFAETGMIAKEHFYEDAFYVMVETHDRNKEFAVKREFKTDLDAPGLYDAFAEYCFISYLDKKYAFTKQEVYNYVEQLPGNTNRRGFLEDMVERACMFVKDGRYYKFVHRNFQQEFCISYMIKHPKEIRRYVERLTDENKVIKDDDELMGRFIRREPELALQYVFLPYMDILFSKDYWYFLRMTHISIGITVQGKTRKISGKYGWAHTSHLYRYLHTKIFGGSSQPDDATPIVIMKPYEGLIGKKKKLCWDKHLRSEYLTAEDFDDPKSDNYEGDYEEIGEVYYVSVDGMINSGDAELLQIIDDDKQCYIKSDYNHIKDYYEELKAKYPGR